MIKSDVLNPIIEERLTEELRKKPYSIDETKIVKYSENFDDIGLSLMKQELKRNISLNINFRNYFKYFPEINKGSFELESENKRFSIGCIRLDEVNTIFFVKKLDKSISEYYPNILDMFFLENVSQKILSIIYNYMANKYRVIEKVEGKVNKLTDSHCTILFNTDSGEQESIFPRWRSNAAGIEKIGEKVTHIIYAEGTTVCSDLHCSREKLKYPLNKIISSSSLLKQDVFNLVLLSYLHEQQHAKRITMFIKEMLRLIRKYPLASIKLSSYFTLVITLSFVFFSFLLNEYILSPVVLFAGIVYSVATLCMVNVEQKSNRTR